MDILVGNVVYVLTDSGHYIRIDRIDNVHIAGSRVKGSVSGTFVDLTDTLTEPTLTQKLNQIKTAQEKYTPVVQLCTRYAFTDNKKTYKGTHNVINPLTSDPNWAIIKYTYTDNNVTMEQGPLIGSWDNRATLGWT